MNLAGWRFLLFAVVGAAAIILLAGIGVPSGKKEVVDRHTGERVVVVETVGDAYHGVRDAGDARIGLARLAKHLARFPESDVLLRLRAVLEAEFSDAAAPPPPQHPHAGAMAAERTRAGRVRDELRHRVRERLNKESLLALLTALEADETQAEALENYFGPLPVLHPDRAVARMGPDEHAARATHADPDADAYLAVARAFRAQGRTRARMRWLLRAYANSNDALRPLYDAYLEHRRLVEAFLLLGTALEAGGDIELWQERAKLAGWLSLPRAEAEAQAALLEHDPSPERRRRLVVLYTYIGEPERAVPHALLLTRGSKDRKELEWPALLALRGGQVDRALELLAGLAKESGDPAYWRERIIHYAWQDMRVERVIAEYRWLAEHYPHRVEYERRLEAVYRRKDRAKELAALLERRLEREPENRALADELLGLHHVLGRKDKVRAIVSRRIERELDPRSFFENLPTYVALEIPGLERRARAMAKSPRLEAADAAFVIDVLRTGSWQAIATIVARRFVSEPAARAFLIARVDSEAGDDLRAVAAEKLALAFPKDRELLKVWIERASWAGSIESEIHGRERWLELRPGDAKNRRALADLYGAVNRAGDALVLWRQLAARDGLRSTATLRLIDALFAAGATKEAEDWLEKRAALPGATLGEHLEVAEQLFGSERLDRALRFFMVVLDSQPDHLLALLRAGQIRSWTNDPRGAIPFFERRLELTTKDAGEVRFHLGEAYWAIQQAGTARDLHRLALLELVRDTVTQDVMRAKILTRLGRFEEARPIFEKVLAGDPRNVDLLLDYADAMLGDQNAARARELTERAKRIAPRRARTVRMDGKVALLERRYEDAAAILEQALELYGPEAGTESELGRAHELAGSARKARDAYQRSLALQPDNRDVEQALGRTWDRVASIVLADFEYRSTGDDSILRAWASGSALLRNDRTRLSALAGLADYRGRAAAVDGGQTDLDETVGHVRLAAVHRFQRLYSFGGGLEAYPGAPGDTPVGGWIDLFLPRFEPHLELGGHIHLHTLFDDPPAAVALGGRKTGVSLFARGDLTRHLWGSIEARYDSLSIDTPAETDGRLDLAASIGCRLIEGAVRVGDALEGGRSELPGLVGPDVRGSPSLTRGPMLSAWVTYQAIRLMGDKRLATLIPIGDRFDYLSVGARADFHVAPGFGVKLEGHAGTELEQASFFFGIDAGATWRPNRNAEFTLLAGYGEALGRSDSENSLSLRFHFSYRW